MQIAKMHMKRCSTLLVIREIQTKVTVRSHFTPIRMTIIETEKDRKGEETSVDEETKKLEQAFKSATSLNSVICL